MIRFDTLSLVGWRGEFWEDVVGYSGVVDEKVDEAVTGFDGFDECEEGFLGCYIALAWDQVPVFLQSPSNGHFVSTGSRYAG